MCLLPMHRSKQTLTHTVHAKQGTLPGGLEEDQWGAQASLQVVSPWDTEAITPSTIMDKRMSRETAQIGGVANGYTDGYTGTTNVLYYKPPYLSYRSCSAWWA